MSEETLYHVDEDDNILGSVTRSEAHEDASLIHREVAVILVDQEGRALLAQRSFNKKVLPGKWDTTCAGYVPWGMEIEDAAHMELQEELGFDTDLVYVGTQLARYDWETHLTHLFVGRYEGQEVRMQESEVEGSALLGKEDVDALGDVVNLEFREFIEAGISGQLENVSELWKKEKDLRS